MAQRWFKVSSFVLSVLLVTACSHLRALPGDEVDRLTTCKVQNLDGIRKSLLLSGYEIKDQTATELITEFKQVNGFEGRRVLRRITVVETAPQQFKFVVRYKSIQYPYQESQYRYRGPLNTAPPPGGNININLGPMTPVENEFDPEYIECNLEEHRTIRNEVCGNK
jgi:hypothetical protein